MTEIADVGDRRSPLDALIPPEVKEDALYRWITRIAALPGLRHLLDIGASSGGGSTEAFVLGALRNPSRPQVHCIEVSRARFRELERRYAGCRFVHCYNVSSVPLEAFPPWDEVAAFRRRVWTRFRLIPGTTVRSWWEADREYLTREGLTGPGVRQVRGRHGIDRFCAVLIDGSEFTGPAELDEVYGARFLLLDDIRSFKNHDNDRRLRRDPRYRLLARSRRPRNGFAVFERRRSAEEGNGPEEIP